MVCLMKFVLLLVRAAPKLDLNVPLYDISLFLSYVFRGILFRGGWDFMEVFDLQRILQNYGTARCVNLHRVFLTVEFTMFS